jgi:hypothetical protein
LNTPIDSFSAASDARCAWAPTTIVRNLSIPNAVPPLPIRVWRNNTGPGESSQIAAAITAAIGARRTTPSVATQTSSARLTSSAARG